MERKAMESRRLKAAAELLEGKSQVEVAKKFGVSRTTASRWGRSLREYGVDRLRLRRATGRPAALTAAQCEKLAQVIRQGPSAAGFDRWTNLAVTAVIEREFGVKYNSDHVGRLLVKLELRSPRARKRAAGVRYGA
jgi:transposase